jgi:hypothetical protein
MPTQKFLLTGLLAIILLAISIVIVFGFHLLSFETLSEAKCNFSKFFTCDMQYGECCGSFTNWCKECRAKDWKDCQPLSNNGPSWVNNCVAYGQAWQFDANFGPQDVDNEIANTGAPKESCKKVCIQ